MILLVVQIDNIDNWVEHARSTLPSFTAGPIKAQIEQVVGRLRIITKDLELIALKLKREMDDGSFKVKKAKWLIKADSIAKLLRKARDAKQDLSWAVNSQQTAMMGHYFTAISHHFILNEQ